jgi:hypothetical protein
MPNRPVSFSFTPAVEALIGEVYVRIPRELGFRGCGRLGEFFLGQEQDIPV